MSAAAPDAVQDFDAAKTIFSALDALPRGRQERVIRWVSEALGIAAAPAAPISAIPAPIQPGPADPALPIVTSGKTIDIQSFIKEKQPQSDIQFVTAVAYYYRFKAPVAEQRTAIDAKFAQDSTRLAGRSRISKPLKALNNAKRKGYLDTHARGQFTINTVGENMVETLPAGAGATKKAAKPPLKPQKGSSKKIKGVRK